MARLSAAKTKVFSLIEPDYEVDQSGLPFYCPRSATESEDRTELSRLVVSEQLQISCTTTTQVWRVFIKESAVLIDISERTFIGVGCIEVCNGM